MNHITARLEAMDLAAIDPAERTEEEQMFIDLVNGRKTFIEFYDWTKYLREIGPDDVIMCSESLIPES